MARIATRLTSWVVPGMIALAVGGVALTSWSELAVRGPLHGPLGYTNANAALYLQGTVAACMIAAGAPLRVVRITGIVLAAGLTGATILVGSQAATLLLSLPLVALLVRTGTGARRFIVVTLILFLTTFAMTGIVGMFVSDVGSGSVGHLIQAALSERRPALWHDALTLTAQNPLLGVGPGRFHEESELARSDPDAAWAHNGFLQQAAEGGVPALILTLSGFVWGFVRLAVAPRSPLAALGAASLGVLGIQACLDYVLHFPALPVIAAALVGAAVESVKTPFLERARRSD